MGDTHSGANPGAGGTVWLGVEVRFEDPSGVPGRKVSDRIGDPDSLAYIAVCADRS